MRIEVKHVRSGKTLCNLDGLNPGSSISDVKQSFHQINSSIYPDRQQWKAGQEKTDKALKDEVTLESVGIDGTSGVLFFKDLGPQISWKTVFLTEYSGPLLAYLPFYFRLSIIYGDAASSPIPDVVHIAAVCWVLHYAKRLLETIFIHRFSHATMPIMNIFKNSGYYWGFAAFVSYFVNHPLYSPAMYGSIQIYLGLAIFVVCELGNLSSHITLRNLRPPGTKERRIPYPDGNPFSYLFNFVSCPNYTYEVGAWVGFAVMTQCLPALLFLLAGFAQMSQWALGKHRNYHKEFDKYPRGRKAIIPFIL